MTPEEGRRQQIEAESVDRRLVELYLAPIRGQFDIDHLKAINQYLFQDLPKHGYDDVTPGEFRQSTKQGKDWIKQRYLESIDANSVVAYSSMDDKAINQLQKDLKAANPSQLKKLKTAEFTKAIGKIYVDCDYAHPFDDGNSRTIREFTRQLAKESGYNLDWSRFNRSAAGRDTLYIARDLSVNERALQTVKNADTKMEIAFASDTFGGNKKLPELLIDAIRPDRAIAFERMEEKYALRKHPELSHAYKTLHSAEAQLKTATPEARDKALHSIKGQLLKNLDEGETKRFRLNPGSQEVTKEHTATKHQEVDRER